MPERSAAGSQVNVPRGRVARALHVAGGYKVLTRALHRTLLAVLDHDVLNIAQSTAYSAIVALFPALIVAAAVIGLLPDTAPVRAQMTAFFDRVLPPGVGPLLDVAFGPNRNHTHSIRALLSASIVSFLGASNVIATLMEGLRRAEEVPDTWTFWERRRRSFRLVLLSLVPLAIVSILVVFGHAITTWLVSNSGSGVRSTIYGITVLVRWGIALGASVSVIGVLYHQGVPDRPEKQIVQERTWQSVLPGAVMATLMWFFTTLAFGWYVTRFANYSEVYGSLGAGIALLFWLYIISLSVLCGAEFNAQFGPQFTAHFGQERAAVWLRGRRHLQSEPSKAKPQQEAKT